MNRQDCDVLNALCSASPANQRELARCSGYSVGTVNSSIRRLIAQGMIDADYRPTAKALRQLHDKAPRNAVILAAGFGMRMVPINLEVPKALLEVGGETMIERLIRQLHEAGVTEICVVVGFMKERFEYLIDEYGVELVVNSEYAQRNNLFSLELVKDRLSNTYILPCNVWCRENPFRRRELYSWYMVNEEQDEESDVRANRSMELVRTQKNMPGNMMTGISYLSAEDAAAVRDGIIRLCEDPKSDDVFWESVLFEKGMPRINARVAAAGEAIRINTYEQLRALDSGSRQLHSDAISVIAKCLNAAEDEIKNIVILKKGMTNRSFQFECRGKKYIMRIPGEGTGRMIDRHHEAAVYRVISGRGLCDDPIHIDPDNGYKITAFLDGVRCCDPSDTEDLKKCMRRLKSFHAMRLKVEHEFDLFGQIEFYESLWEGKPSMYKDYPATKSNVLRLKRYIEAHAGDKVLTHIDAVPDNFLFYDRDGTEALQLADWEYAGMQDPHVDIAMFCIYSLYGREQIDRLIDIYFEGNCPRETRIKIYCYVAVCGLLWSNWCEYKCTLGVEFGEYNLRQYRYAKDFYRLAVREMEQTEQRKQTDEQG